MTWHLIYSIIIALLSGGTIPFLIKLYKDKKKLKQEAEDIQNQRIDALGKRVDKVDNKINILGDILVIYIEANGGSPNIKRIAKKKIKELKEME